MAVGFRGPFPLGLGVPQHVQTYGVRSMFAFWMGGAGFTDGGEPTPTTGISIFVDKTTGISKPYYASIRVPYTL
jgi:hypothetical protein